MSKQRIFWLILFLLCVIGDLIAVSTEWQLLEWICKPLLMPTLLAYFYTSISKRHKRRSISRFMQYALIFSTLGDIALMLEKGNFLFFVAGLLFFLLAHVQYINLFRRWAKPDTNKQAQQQTPSLSSAKSIAAGVVIIVYGVVLYATLYDKLDDIVLKVAVFVYAATITTMVLFSLATRHTRSRLVLMMLLLGALLFVLSDSLIAGNKFLTEIAYAQLLIMVTYILAQYLLVEGTIKGLREGI